MREEGSTGFNLCGVGYALCERKLKTEAKTEPKGESKSKTKGKTKSAQVETCATGGGISFGVEI
jgi:hypothetical protein